jgi:hypothetical protein
MNTAYYALGNKNRFGEGGLTMVTMQQGQMGVSKFNTMYDSFKHRDSCHALKRNIAGMNDKSESGKISKSGYHKHIGVWCASVESFTDEWSSERVIALKQSDVEVLQPGRSWYLLRLVLILYCLDHL